MELDWTRRLTRVVRGAVGPISYSVALPEGLLDKDAAAASNVRIYADPVDRRLDVLIAFSPQPPPPSLEEWVENAFVDPSGLIIVRSAEVAGGYSVTARAEIGRGSMVRLIRLAGENAIRCSAAYAGNESETGEGVQAMLETLCSSLTVL